MNGRNMLGREINILSRIVHLFGLICESFSYCYKKFMKPRVALYSFFWKPTRCTISQLYFGKELYMFRTDLLSTIRSLYYCIHSNWHLSYSLRCRLLSHSYVDCMLADSQHNYMTNTSCCEYSMKTPDDGQWICPKHIEFFIKIKLRNSASFWLLL